MVEYVNYEKITAFKRRDMMSNVNKLGKNIAFIIMEMII